MKSCAALLLMLCAVAAAPPTVSAHPAPFSYLDIVFREDEIEGSLTVHIIDVAHDLGMPVDRLLDDAVVQAERQRIFALLTPRIALRGLCSSSRRERAESLSSLPSKECAASSTITSRANRRRPSSS